MNDNPQHTFQVLTKRAERFKELDNELSWSKNIWLGVSVENMDVMHRIEKLRQSSAAIKFLSLEPLIGPLPNIDLRDVDWVIVGGESGRKPRPMESQWVTDIQQQCKDANVAFFFKQWGGTNKKKAGRLLHGRTYDEMPNCQK